jgi:hypothetical protein
MDGKFDSVQTDEGTTISFRTEATLGNYEVLYEKWSWDGIQAESIIFANVDIIDLNDKELEAEVKASPLVKPNSNITIKRSDSGFTFVNFNFET